LPRHIWRRSYNLYGGRTLSGRRPSHSGGRSRAVPRGASIVTMPVTAAAAVGTRLGGGSGMGLAADSGTGLASAAVVAIPDTIPPYNQTVGGRIMPLSRELLVRLSKEGRALSLDGVPVFNGDDKFLPGKIALSLAEFLVTVPADDPRRANI